jgi:hypothetical protein
MKPFMTSLIFLLVVQLAFSPKKEEKLVHMVFEKYNGAILNNEGKDAANYVDSRTIN